jgi:N-acetyl-gamma-glutamylphosphate reductase
MAVETVESIRHPIVVRKMAEITPQTAQLLPRDFLNAILSVAAVHMAVRNPANRSIGRLALEIKNRFFEGINNAVQQPQHQRADVLIVCITLLFAMEVCVNILFTSSFIFNIGTDHRVREC